MLNGAKLSYYKHVVLQVTVFAYMFCLTYILYFIEKGVAENSFHLKTVRAHFITHQACHSSISM